MTAQGQPLGEEEIQERLAQLPGWSVEDDLLRRSYSFDENFAAAAALLHVAAIQEELGHHAVLTLSYQQLRVAVNTHSAGGRVTDLDFDLARRVEKIAPGHGAR
ncbi:4a-hydroxytetrahydrobiopterin dehydratase [Streptomyces sp. NPDC048248]|uniref:4a-hydroxytetrahydrobiopterin dehydratase n=1 Tax=Streptomyces sp. NPDC048248 TaxID=3365523 RepID=UPI00371E7AFF